MKIIVDTHLRISADDWDELPSAAHTLIKQALTVRETDDEGEVHEDSETIQLYGGDSDGNITLPRGFAIKLRKGLSSFNIPIEWDDRRVSVPVDLPVMITAMSTRSYQDEAIKAMVDFEQGIYEAPPGSGKTISSAFMLSEAPQRTIILVNKMNIATQWVHRIKQALGIDVGRIGDGQWQEADITVATWQTLWARREELDASGWWSNWGRVMLDECHAISGMALREIIQRFPARSRIGLSATPDRHEWLTMASRAILGEIICRTTDEQLESEGVLIKPKVFVVKTDFFFPWDRRGDHRAQWQKMMKALKFDKGRNEKIAQLFAMQRGHSCLVHTDQKTHAHELAKYALEAGWPKDSVFLLTGDQNDAQRQAVIERASAAGDCIVFSTIGQEAMDIPRLDRFFLVWPSKNGAMVKQMWGRLGRTHETKIQAPIVFDLWDHRIETLSKHFSKRRGQYDRDKLPLTFVD